VTRIHRRFFVVGKKNLALPYCRIRVLDGYIQIGTMPNKDGKLWGKRWIFFLLCRYTASVKLDSRIHRRFFVVGKKNLALPYCRIRVLDGYIQIGTMPNKDGKLWGKRWIFLGLQVHMQP